MTRFSIVKLWLEVITASVSLFWPSRIARRSFSFNPRIVMLSTSTSSVSLYEPGRISIMSPGTHRSSAAWIDSPGLMRNKIGWRCCRLGFKDPPTAAGGIAPAWLGFKDPPTTVGGIAFAWLGFKDPPAAAGWITLAGLDFEDPPAAVGGFALTGLGFKDSPTAVGGITPAVATLVGGSMAEPRAFGVNRGTTGRPDGTFSGISGFFDSSVSEYRNAIRSVFSWSESLNRRILSSRFGSCNPSPWPPPFE